MFSANTCSEHFFAIFSPLFQNLTELNGKKISMFSGTNIVDTEGNTHATVVTVNDIALDPNTGEMLLKVNGADTPTPFSSGSDPQLLWTNPDGTVAWDAQAITVDSTGYDSLMIKCRTATGSDLFATTILDKSLTSPTQSMNIYAGAGRYRGVSNISDSSITIGNCSVGNTYVIPLFIYGVKYTV